MRAWEFLAEGEFRPPVRTLKSVNDAKQDRQYRERCAQERNPVVSIMYRDLDRDKEWLEVERARLELEQLKTEIAAQKAELAVSQAEASARSQRRVSELARSHMRKRKKEKQDK